MNAFTPIPTQDTRPRTFASRADTSQYCAACQEWSPADRCLYCDTSFSAGDTLDPYGDVATDAPGYWAAPFTRFDGVRL